MRLYLFLLTVGSLPAAEPNRIFFAHGAPSKATIFISNADGGEEHSLLQSTSLDYNPSWSPDGRWIVFTSERNGSADLYRVKPDGSGLEQLTDNPAYDDQAAFSPDSDRIVFVTTRANGHANLWTMDLRTRKATPLTSGADGGNFRPSWSPDGKWIAFSSDRGSTLPMGKGRWEHLQIADVYLIHPDGSGLKRLTEHGNFCGSPKWSGDSKRVVAYCMSGEETLTYRIPPQTIKQGETRLVSIDIASGETANVAAGPGVKMAPAFLPSGEVAYIRKAAGAPGIFYNMGQPGPKGSDLRSASWSPDGTRVVYHRVGPSSGPAPKLWSRNPNYDLRSGALASFDPSGEHYAAPDFAGLLIFDNNSNSSPPRPIFKPSGRIAISASWSPRGDTILLGLGAFNAFQFKGDFSTGRVDGGAQVAMIKPDGSGFREVTSGANNNGFPSFAPDGKRFVYRTAGPEGQGLRIMDLETNKVTTLTTEYDNFPLWSPRGDLIAFVRQYHGDYEIFTIHPDGKSTRRLTYSPGNDAHGSWSPDGQWIVFSSTRMGFKDEALYTDGPQPYGELFVMRHDGTHVQQLTDNQWEDGGATWQPTPKVGVKH
jgi:TolB protein